MTIWDDVITERDSQVYAKSGYGGRVGPGKKPAVIVIDVTTAFVGDRPEPILKSIERFPNSCGEAGWKAVGNISKLLDVARAKGVPVFYSASATLNQFSVGRWREKHGRAIEEANAQMVTPEHIPKEISPRKGDIVIAKLRPSVFFGTPLASHLVSLGVDTLIATGCTTSGCVRATVIDSFSYTFRTLVVEECVFDRGETSHKVNLFDMHQKYADVVSLRSALEYLQSVAPNNVNAEATIKRTPARTLDSV